MSAYELQAQNQLLSEYVAALEQQNSTRKAEQETLMLEVNRLSLQNQALRNELSNYRQMVAAQARQQEIIQAKTRHIQELEIRILNLQQLQTSLAAPAARISHEAPRQQPATSQQWGIKEDIDTKLKRLRQNSQSLISPQANYEQQYCSTREKELGALGQNDQNCPSLQSRPKQTGEDEGQQDLRVMVGQLRRELRHVKSQFRRMEQQTNELFLLNRYNRTTSTLVPPTHHQKCQMPLRVMKLNEGPSRLVSKTDRYMANPPKIAPRAKKSKEKQPTVPTRDSTQAIFLKKTESKNNWENIEMMISELKMANKQLRISLTN